MINKKNLISHMQKKKCIYRAHINDKDREEQGEGKGEKERERKGRGNAKDAYGASYPLGPMSLFSIKYYIPF